MHASQLHTLSNVVSKEKPSCDNVSSCHGRKVQLELDLGGLMASA
jgi:hypothetical protein